MPSPSTRQYPAQLRPSTHRLVPVPKAEAVVVDIDIVSPNATAEEDETASAAARLEAMRPAVNRRHGRESWRQPVVVRALDEHGGVCDRGFAEVLDLSFGGAKLNGLTLSRGLDPSRAHRLQFTLVLDDGHLNLDVSTRPVWADSDGDDDDRSGARVLGVVFEQVQVRYS